MKNKSTGVTRCLSFEVLALAISNLLACVVGVSSQYRFPFASPEYFDLMAWPVVAVPSVFCMVLACIVYYTLRRNQLRWILFGIGGAMQLLIGSFIGRSMDF